MIASVQGMFRVPRMYVSGGSKMNCAITTRPAGESSNYVNRIGVSRLLGAFGCESSIFADARCAPRPILKTCWSSRKSGQCIFRRHGKKNEAQ